MAYTDSDKVVMEAWGKFRVTLLEAVEPGDLMSWYNTDSDYTCQFADQSGSQRADCIAMEAGAAHAEIWACLKAELKTISTIGAGGAVTRVYFAAADDLLGSPIYLGAEGKPSSSEGGTYSQLIGRLVARDRIMLDMTGANVLASPTFTGTATFEGPVAMEGVLGVAGVTTFAGAVIAGDGTTNVDVKIYLGASTGYYALFDATNTIFRLNNVPIVYYGADPAITLDQAAGIHFRSSGSRIYSNAAGRLIIACTNTGVAALQLQVGAGGGIWLNSYLVLSTVVSAPTQEGALYYNTTTYDNVRFRDGTGVCQIWHTDSTGVAYPSGNLVMQTTQAIGFRAIATIYINSGTGTRLDVVAPTIYLNASVEIQLTNFLRIAGKASGSEGAVIGQVWYNTTTHKLQYFEGGGGGVKTITAS